MGKGRKNRQHTEINRPTPRARGRISVFIEREVAKGHGSSVSRHASINLDELVL